MRPDKLILDVNVWVSYILQQRLKELAAIILRYELNIFISPSLVAELEDVLQRPKIAKYLTLDKQEYLDFIISLTAYSSPTSSFTNAPDPKDNYLFDLALAAGATHLVTGDKPLLAKDEIAGIKIITLRAFRELFGEG
jgi:putative PIN family toxin of toxin-antitoxin system